MDLYSVFGVVFVVLICLTIGFAGGVSLRGKNNDALSQRSSREIAEAYSDTRNLVGQIKIDLDKLGNEIKGLRDMLKTYETNRK